MKDEQERLMAWQPGAPGFSHDDIIVAVGLQCRTKQFPVADVLQWLGPPEKCIGDASAGHLVYFYSYDFWGAPKFDVLNGKVVNFGVVNIHEPNAKRADPETGKEILFNLLDEMEPFNEAKFK
jgi:hypothetical protein